MPRNISFDQREQGIQQVEPAMDVPNCIDPHSIGQGGLAPVGLASDILQWHSHSPSLISFAAGSCRQQSGHSTQPGPAQQSAYAFWVPKYGILLKCMNRAYFELSLSNQEGSQQGAANAGDQSKK